MTAAEKTRDPFAAVNAGNDYVADSLANYISNEVGVEMSAVQARAFLAFHATWQRNRGSERDAIRAQRAADREAANLEKLLASEDKIKEQLAKIAAAKKVKAAS